MIKVITKEIDEEICKKIEEINKRYLTKEGFCEEDELYCEDNEEYHIVIDNFIIDLLEELGYKETAEMLRKAKEHFWYS